MQTLINNPEQTTVIIKKKADLETALGKKLAANVAKLRGGNVTLKRYPSMITFTAVKPKFCLDDGTTLHVYPVNLETCEIGEPRYCGCYDTIFNHPEQLNETATAPDNRAMMFIEKYWNGRNTSWSLTMVSPNIPKQVG